MGKKIRFSYDREGDVLDISLGKPRNAVSREIREDVFIRLDPKSHEIVGFSVINFERGFRKSGEFKTIPVSAKFALAAE